MVRTALIFLSLQLRDYVDGKAVEKLTRYRSQEIYLT